MNEQVISDTVCASRHNGDKCILSKGHTVRHAGERESWPLASTEATFDANDLARVAETINNVTGRIGYRDASKVLYGAKDEIERQRAALDRVEALAAKIGADKGLDGSMGLVTSAIATEIRRAINGE